MMCVLSQVLMAEKATAQLVPSQLQVDLRQQLTRLPASLFAEVLDYCKKVEDSELLGLVRAACL